MSQKKKILIIDDEAKLALVIKMSLEATGNYEVITAVSGATGLELSKTQQPDFIFLDLNMPDLNGFHVKYQLEEDPATKHIPVVFLTATVNKEGPTADPQTDDQMLGSYPYLVKLVTTEEMIDIIESHTQKEE